MTTILATMSRFGTTADLVEIGSTSIAMVLAT